MMKRIWHLHRLAALLVAGALVLAACGDASDEQLPTVDPTTQDDPAVAGVCAPDEPDCVDTVVAGDDPEPLPPADEPDGGDGAVPSLGGVLVDGGLTVSEALSTDATGILAVRGFIVDDGVETRLCELLAESFPPQCGGASVTLAGYQSVDVGPLTRAQGVTWTDQPVVIFGELANGILVVDPSVAG